MLRHGLVLVSFFASFFVEPVPANAAHRREARVVPLPPVTIATSEPRARWSDALVCAGAAYLPPLARWCSDTGAAALRRAVAEGGAWLRAVVDAPRRAMTAPKHVAAPPARVLRHANRRDRNASSSGGIASCP